MPVGPVNAIGLDVQVHGIDADVGVTLVCLLIHHPRIQTADLIVIGNVEHLFINVQTCRWTQTV